MSKIAKGRLIVIDGLDGCGKGTQLKLLMKKYPDRGRVIFTREPGGTPYGEKIRRLILEDDSKDTQALTQLLLQFAQRVEHMEMIRKYLMLGISAFSDRCDSSTLAFQLHGEKALELMPIFQLLRAKTVAGLNPHYIILNLSAEEAHRRMEDDRNRQATHYDLRPLEYHERVYKGFQQVAEYAEVSYINAGRSIEEVYRDISILVEDILGF